MFDLCARYHTQLTYNLHFLYMTYETPTTITLLFLDKSTQNYGYILYGFGMALWHAFKFHRKVRRSSSVAVAIVVLLSVQLVVVVVVGNISVLIV